MAADADGNLGCLGLEDLGDWWATFRAPYAGESLTAALPGPTPSMAFTLIQRARQSLLPPEDEIPNDAVGFASYYGPLVAPPKGLSTLSCDPARLQTEPPACHRASWQLPGPDFHRQATPSLRTRRSAMAHRHGVTSRSAERTRAWVSIWYGESCWNPEVGEKLLHPVVIGMTVKHCSRPRGPDARI